MANFKKLTLPANVVLLAALILSLLVTISLPLLTALDISRISARDGTRALEVEGVSVERRFGVWTSCAWDYKDNKSCEPRGVGYAVALGLADSQSEEPPKIIWITGAWTRGLGIHPVVTGAEVLALGASLTTMHTINLLAPLVCLLAAAITLIAFAIDIALHVHIIVTIKRLPITAGFVRPNVSAGPGFWITLVILVLNVAAAVILFIARRREMRGESAYPTLSANFQAKGFLSRFRK
ncbi:hypothetical protein BKA70DRAFT_1296701 [Coprinopsis sp. MPI-PUGE-AT-0042]|nr:hypothetical protein BKA70DRAFT_1296701 [Coprinopsis sp. MPI-PUGE-AT-0042]